MFQVEWTLKQVMDHAGDQFSSGAPLKWHSSGQIKHMRVTRRLQYMDTPSKGTLVLGRVCSATCGV